MENDQYELFEETVCRECGKRIPRLDAFIVEKIVNNEEVELPFCNEQEANDYYLEKLRSEGL